MKYSALCVFLTVATVLAFGVPDVPDVPDTDLPEIDIPGLDILDGIQVQLDELVSVTDSLQWLIPELSALDDVSAKLEELRETDPDVIGLQEELDALRAQLVDARAEIEEVTGSINDEVESVRSSLDTFVDGLPGASD